MFKLFLIIPTLRNGGAERVISELANEFIKTNEVHLVTLFSSDHFYYLDPNIMIHNISDRDKMKKVTIITHIKTILSLRSFLKIQKPDIIVSFMEYCNLVCMLSSFNLNIKVFISDRNNIQKRTTIINDILKKHLYKYATGIIAQTCDVKNILIKKTGNKNIKVIPNPIKEIQINTKFSKENIILNVGRLVPEKGQKNLINIFHQANRQDWKLIIIGEGRLRNELERQIKELNLCDSVILPGNTQNIDEWYNRAKIFAFTSISEGFPNALLEAMGAGLPCISYDCDFGAKDIIRHNENGYLVNINDTSSFVNFINLLIHNEELRVKIGYKALKTNRQYNLSKIATIYLDFITNS